MVFFIIIENWREQMISSVIEKIKIIKEIFNKESVYIYSMGKVGSTSIEKSLERYGV